MIVLSLSPFQNYFYYDYSGIKDYLIQLQGFHQMDNDPAVDFCPGLVQGIETGIFQQINVDLAFLKHHPLFRFFLQRKIPSALVKQQFQDHFKEYYFNLAKELYGRMKSGHHYYYQEALEVIHYEYPNLLEVVLSNIDSGDEVFLYTAVIHQYFDHYQKSREWLSLCLHLKRRLEALPDGAKFSTYVTILDDIGNAYLTLGNPEKGEETFLEAIELCEQFTTSNEFIDKIKSAIYTNLGNCATDLYQQIEWQIKAFNIEAQLKESQKIGDVAFNLSEAYFELRELHKSKYYLEIALKFYQNKKGLYGLIKTYQCLSSHAQIKKEYDEAENYLKKALTIANQIENNYQKGIILQEMASLYYLKKEYGEAEAYCKDAITFFIKFNDSGQQASALNLMSVIAFEANWIEDGLDYAKRALVIYNQIADYSQMAQIFRNIALTSYRQNWFKECVSEIKKAIYLYEKVGTKFYAAQCRRLLASALWELKNFRQCKKEILRSIRFFVEIKATDEIQYCMKVVHIFLQQMNDKKFELEVKRLLKNIPVDS